MPNDITRTSDLLVGDIWVKPSEGGGYELRDVSRGFADAPLLERGFASLGEAAEMAHQVTSQHRAYRAAGTATLPLAM